MNSFLSSCVSFRRLGVVVTALCLAAPVFAQNETPAATPAAPSANADNNSRQRPRGFGGSPEEMRAAMSARMKEAFEVTNDEEWALISERMTKVAELRMSTMMSGFGGMMLGGAPGGQNNDRGNRGGGGTRFGGRAPNPELDALQAAITQKASETDLKERIARLRDARKANEEKLQKAQEELRAVLSVRQEAIAVSMGMLN